jgi:hypothetical protein
MADKECLNITVARISQIHSALHFFMNNTGPLTDLSPLLQNNGILQTFKYFINYILIAVSITGLIQRDFIGYRHENAYFLFCISIFP